LGASGYQAHPSQTLLPHVDPVKSLLDNVPESLLATAGDNNVIGVILVAVGFGWPCGGWRSDRRTPSRCERRRSSGRIGAALGD